MPAFCKTVGPSPSKINIAPNNSGAKASRWAGTFLSSFGWEWWVVNGLHPERLLPHCVVIGLCHQGSYRRCAGSLTREPDDEIASPSNIEAVRTATQRAQRRPSRKRDHRGIIPRSRAHVAPFCTSVRIAPPRSA